MKIRLADSHTDFLTVMTKKEREQYIKRCAKMGVELLLCAVFTTEKMITLKDVTDFKAELNYLEKKYRIKLLLTIEDLGFVKNDRDLEELVKIQPFSVTLTWNEANQYAGGAHSDIGLTELGRKTLKYLETNNIVVDTGHLSEKAFWDVVKVSEKPIFNSHCNIYSIKAHVRNLKDAQIKAIVNSGGYMGITIYDEFIGETKIDSSCIYNQFKYLINKFGADCFGLGTDLYGINVEHLPEDIKGYADVYKLKNFLLEEYDFTIVEKLLSENLCKFVDRMWKTVRKKT